VAERTQPGFHSPPRAKAKTTYPFMNPTQRKHPSSNETTLHQAERGRRGYHARCPRLQLRRPHTGYRRPRWGNPGLAASYARHIRALAALHCQPLCVNIAQRDSARSRDGRAARSR